MATTDLYSFNVEIWREGRKYYYVVEQTVKGAIEVLGKGETTSWASAGRAVNDIITDNMTVQE